ncbi:MAG: hypothetical protein WAZ18_04735 [Alphaproteobacteria bacterium]
MTVFTSFESYVTARTALIPQLGPLPSEDILKNDYQNALACAMLFDGPVDLIAIPNSRGEGFIQAVGNHPVCVDILNTR